MPLTRKRAALILIAAPVVAFTCWQGLNAAMCVNDIVYRLPAPSGHKRAIVFQRDCGATTPFSTQVAISHTGILLPSEYGNAFIATAHDPAVPQGPGGGPPLHVRWLGADTLEIAYHPKSEVVHYVLAVGTTHIRLRPDSLVAPN